VRHWCLALLALLPAAARAGEWIEIGARLELLDVTQPLDFSCDEPCDTEKDPTCESVPADQLCHGSHLDGKYAGWLFGPSIGLQFGDRFWSAGLRLAGTLGSFHPTHTPDSPSPGAEADDPDAVLGHVSLELPLELRLGGASDHVFLQAVPRLGVLNYLSGLDEEPDTFTAGILFVAGVRFGAGGGSLGADAGVVRHKSFGGWLAELGWRADLNAPSDP
jgi:hypothetical protein